MKIYPVLFLTALAKDYIKIKISETNCFGIKNFGKYNKIVTLKCEEDASKIKLDENRNLLHGSSCIKIESTGKIINVSCQNQKRFIYENGLVFRKFTHML